MTSSTVTTETVEARVVDNHDGTVTIRYRVSTPGVYNVDLKFGGVPVPQGRIVQTVGTPCAIVITITIIRIIMGLEAVSASEDVIGDLKKKALLFIIVLLE